MKIKDTPGYYFFSSSSSDTPFPALQKESMKANWYGVRSFGIMSVIYGFQCDNSCLLTRQDSDEVLSAVLQLSPLVSLNCFFEYFLIFSN